MIPPFNGFNDFNGFNGFIGLIGFIGFILKNKNETDERRGHRACVIETLVPLPNRRSNNFAIFVNTAFKLLFRWSSTDLFITSQFINK